MTTTDAVNIVTSVVGGIGDTLVGVLPVILTLAGILIGLGIAMRYVKRWLGSR
jgi:hypothetical protein